MWSSDGLSANSRPFVLHQLPTLHAVNANNVFDFGLFQAWLPSLHSESKVCPCSPAPRGMTHSKKWQRVLCWIHSDHSWHGEFPGTSHSLCKFSHSSLQGLCVCGCVWMPSWTALKQPTVTDGPKACLPLPSRINTPPAPLLNVTSVQYWEILGGQVPDSLNGVEWTGTQPWSARQSIKSK